MATRLENGAALSRFVVHFLSNCRPPPSLLFARFHPATAMTIADDDAGTVVFEQNGGEGER